MKKTQIFANQDTSMIIYENEENYEKEIEVSANHDVPMIIYENEENYKMEIEGSINQDIPMIIHKPKVVLNRLKRKEYEKYIKNEQQPLAFIENTISSKVSIHKSLLTYLIILNLLTYLFVVKHNFFTM